MTEIYLFTKTLFWIFILLFILGMIKPWWVLWFMEKNNRMDVIKYYGSITILLLIIVLVMQPLI